MTDNTDNPAPIVDNPAPDNVVVDKAPVVVDKPVDNKPVDVVAPTWRDDWRQAMAKGDVKELERLQRIPSPESLFDSYRNLEKKMSGMKVPPTLSENPNETELAEYRRNVGIPEKPEGYYEKFPKGLVIGEEDKPAMDMLAQALHAKNAHPDVVAAVVDTYYKIIEKNQEEMVTYQRALQQETADALRAELGADYRATMNAVNAMLDGVDADTKSLFEGMQLADGSLAFNHLGFMRWFSGIATQINPAALVLPGQNGGDKMETVKQQIDANLAEMKKNINAWQSPANASRRQEHIKLLEAADKFGVKY
jgi:hypothetical protein